MKDSKRVLFIDIEGGWGGSSRSLYYLIKNLDKTFWEPFVVVGKVGPIIKKYRESGVVSYYFPDLPRITAMERNNWRALIRFLLKMIYLPGFLRLIRKIIHKRRIDIIHLNHESLFFVGFCFKLLFDCKIVSHVRTMLPVNSWAKIQVAVLAYASDYMIFITENEKSRYQAIWPKSTQKARAVIYNSAETVALGKSRENGLSNIGKVKIASMMTVSFRRGTDQLVDVALELKQMNEDKILFVICGKEDGDCGRVMRGHIRMSGLDEYFLFLGHCEAPEEIIQACDLLIRPSRENNPWGRDVIEAMMIGKPIIAIGEYQGFIQDQVNGYMYPEFNAREIAKKITELAENQDVLKRISAQNIIKASRMFNGRDQAAKVAVIYDRLLRKGNKV